MLRKLIAIALVVAAFAGAFLAGQDAANADPPCPDGTNWDIGQNRCL